MIVMSMVPGRGVICLISGGREFLNVGWRKERQRWQQGLGYVSTPRSLVDRGYDSDISFRIRVCFRDHHWQQYNSSYGVSGDCPLRYWLSIPAGWSFFFLHCVHFSMPKTSIWWNLTPGPKPSFHIVPGFRIVRTVESWRQDQTGPSWLTPTTEPD